MVKPGKPTADDAALRDVLASVRVVLALNTQTLAGVVERLGEISDAVNRQSNAIENLAKLLTPPSH